MPLFYFSDVYRVGKTEKARPRGVRKGIKMWATTVSSTVLLLMLVLVALDKATLSVSGELQEPQDIRGCDMFNRGKVCELTMDNVLEINSGSKLGTEQVTLRDEKLAPLSF